MQNWLDLSHCGVNYGDDKDCTYAVREAVRLIRRTTADYGFGQRYCGIAISGKIRTKNIPELSDPAYNGTTILLSGEWQLDETLTATRLKLLGQPWYSAPGWIKTGGSLLTPGPAMPEGSTVLRLVGHAGCQVRDIVIDRRRGVGLESWGSNRLLENVHVHLRSGDGPEYPAIVIGNGYCIHLHNVGAHRFAEQDRATAEGYPRGAVAIIGSDPSRSPTDYTGILSWSDSVCQGGTIIIGSESSDYQWSVRGVDLARIITEYGSHGSGEHFITTRGYVEGLTVHGCSPADARDGVSVVHNGGTLYGLRISGPIAGDPVVSGNPVVGLEWSVGSAGAANGFTAGGGGRVNGTAFGDAESDGWQSVPARMPAEWELALRDVPSGTNRGPDMVANSAFEMGPGTERMIGELTLPLAVGDVILCEAFCRVPSVDGVAQRLPGGEIIVGVPGAMLRLPDNWPAMNYFVNGWRAWPIANGANVRTGGHWRRVVAAGIIGEVTASSIYTVYKVRGISHPTLFWRPRWWRIPAGEWDGIEHLQQIARYVLGG